MATVQSRTQEQVVHQALEVMLQQQLPDAWDMKALCSLLQVSKACRKAVFDSGVSCSLSPQHFAASGSSDPSMQRIMGFASWLPSHAPLVSSLELCAPQSEADTAVAEQPLTMAVKLCAQQQASPAQSRTPTGLIQPLAGLRLQSLHSKLLLQPAALTALGACSHLTQMCIKEVRPGAMSAPVLCALGALTGLKSLDMLNRPHGVSQQDSTHLAASLAQLQQLERLVYMGSGGLPLSCLRQLPGSLVTLEVFIAGSRPADAPVTFDLGQLTALQSLNIFWRNQGTVPSVLPASLTGLTVACARIGADVPTFSRLVSLDMTVDLTQPSLLQHVHGMPLLRNLVLGLALLGPAGNTPLTEGHAQATAAALAAASQVTCLELFRKFPSSPGRWHENDAVMLLRPSLLQLQSLSSLRASAWIQETCWAGPLFPR